MQTFQLHEGIALPGYLFATSSVTTSPTPTGSRMAGGGQFNFTDVIFTGPAGATSVQVTFTMSLDVFISGGPDWEANLRFNVVSNGATGSSSQVQGQLVSVTETVALDGGSPVSRSGPQGIEAYAWHREFVGGGGAASGMSRFKVPHGCNAPVFTFSLPGCSASSVSAGIVDNRLPLTSECCPADFNDSGGPTVQDIFDYLAAYFASDPAADFNAVNGHSVQDIFDFLAAYFGGCA